MVRLRAALLPCLVLLACPSSEADDDPFGGGVGTAASAGPTSSAGGSSEGMGEAGSSAGSTGPSSATEGGELLLDVGAGDLDVPSVGCEGGDGSCGCDAVDLLFVIDNSGSMEDYQEALGLAFPSFATTLAEVLPAGTSVHVAVTSTEMDYSSGGQSVSMNGVCTFIGDDGRDNEAFYVPPDEVNTGRNGAQGRFYDPGDGQTYFAFETDGDVAGAQAWFTMAANIGVGGSNIEMATAPVGWAFEPANAPTNGGFLRDEGAVLVVFFMQDEADQSPTSVDGVETGTWALERVAVAKAGCGGLDCVVAGGFLNDGACMGDRPIATFLDGVDDPVVGQLPNEDDAPQDIADEMTELLSNSLATLIGQTCDEITPEG